MITGESRSYSISKAAWGGITPANPFSLSGGGIGAWELALRYSFADLDDHENTFRTNVNGASFLVGTRGGVERNFTIGLNWTVNPYIRFMLNYIRADIDRQTAGNAPGFGGLSSGDTIDIFGLRAQVKW